MELQDSLDNDLDELILAPVCTELLNALYARVDDVVHTGAQGLAP